MPIFANFPILNGGAVVIFHDITRSLDEASNVHPPPKNGLEFFEQPSRTLVSEHRDAVVIITLRVTPAPPADQSRLSLSQLEDTMRLEACAESRSVYF